MARKAIPDPIKKKLFTLSGNQCCFPGCSKRIYDLENEVLLGEICHIIAVNPFGARYDMNYPEHELNAYDNLILLCPNHHTIVDKDEEKYTIETLREFKQKHEDKFYTYSPLIDHVNNSFVGELNNEKIENLINSLSNDEERTLPPKPDYEHPRKYIPRVLHPIRKSKEEPGGEPRTAIEILKDNDHITIIGVAGTGKSIELDHIASVFSNPESGFYPIKVRLNTVTNQTIEELLKVKCNNFQDIPPSKLIVLLDALDEVHSNYLDIVVRNIMHFAQKFHKSKIVVTCRNNFYTVETDRYGAKIDGFATYLINNLDYYSIQKYLSENVFSNIKYFSDTLSQYRMFDLLYSPFYLVNLVDFYNQKGVVPQTKKEVFEYLITKRIEADQAKYLNTGIKIEYYSKKVEDQLEELAVIAECLGRNYLLEKEEVLEIISEEEIFEVVKHTFLFNKSTETNKWEFEHNNFKEYLAAKFLSKLDFKSIKKFVSYEPRHERIKPTWLNTISFLFSMLEKPNELIEWLLKNEPDALIRFEKNRIGLEEREDLFIKIYEDLETKGLLIRNEKFESEDLALFVSDSTSIIKYLLNKAKVSTTRLAITEAIRLFKHFENISTFHNEIRKVIVEIICNKNSTDEIKYSCLTELTELDLFNKEDAKKILETNKLESGQYIRAGIFKYLAHADDVDDYLHILFQGMVLAENRNAFGNSDSYLSDERYTLEEFYKKFDSPGSIMSIMEWAIKYDGNISYERLFFDLITHVLSKVSHEQTDLFFNPVVELLNSFSRKYFRELGQEFKLYFENTHTELKAFKYILDLNSTSEDQKKLENTFALSVVSSEECIDYAIEQFQQGKLSEELIYYLRHILSWDGPRKLHDYMQQKLLIIDQKFAYQIIDHDALKRARINRDLELLFDKSAFLAETENVFLEEATENGLLKWKELFNYSRRKFNDQKMQNNLVVDTLRNFASNKKITTLEEIRELVNDQNRWEWFILHKLVEYDSRDSDFYFGNEPTEFLTNWVYNNYSTANFYSAIEAKKGKTYKYQYKELYICYFTMRLDLDLHSDYFLDFLAIDCSFLPQKPKSKNQDEDSESFSALLKHVIKKAGLEKTKARILDNILNKRVVPIVRTNHYKFCSRYKLSEVSTSILDDIIGEEINLKYDLIEDYIQISKDLGELVYRLNDIKDESLRTYAVEQLARAECQPVGDYCLDELPNITDEDNKLRYIKCLFLLSKKSSLSHLKKWILTNKHFPQRWSYINKLSASDLPDLIEIYEDSLKNEYGSSVWSSRNDFLSPMIELASKNPEDYNLMHTKILYWIENYPDTNFLYYQLQKLEQLYYEGKERTMSFSEVKSIIRTCKELQDINTLNWVNRFWQSYNIPIQIILAVLTVLSFILMFFM